MNQAASESNIAPGTILAGKYRVARVLGRGGMGVVVEAQHIQLDDRVALKFLLPEYATHPEASERFLREARAAVKIKSEHVARVSDVGTLETGAPYMVMEYLNGDDLSNMLEKGGPMPLQDAVDYVIQGCEAINEAHTLGIVHRDIKPANLFVTKRPDGSPLVKVLDFGISKTMGGGVDGLTKTTATMGSALYMSPEQMRQSRSVDHRTDIYSLGITLYELLAGKQPFYANTLPELCAEVLTGNPTPLRDIRSDLPPEFASVLEKSYARTLDQRYQTVGEFVFSLAPYAPPRSQETLDRFARLNNMQSPQAGRPDPRASSGNFGMIQAGPYNTNVPHSQRSTAAFAAGQAPGQFSNTNATASLSTTNGGLPKSSTGAVVGILIAFGALAALGGGAWFYMTKMRGAAAHASEPTSASSGAAPQSSGATSRDTPATTSTTPSNSTSSAPSASAVEMASATPSASAAASPIDRKADKPSKPKPGEPAKPVETQKPVEAQPKPTPAVPTSKPVSNDDGFGHR